MIPGCTQNPPFTQTSTKEGISLMGSTSCAIQDTPVRSLPSMWYPTSESHMYYSREAVQQGTSYREELHRKSLWSA